MTFKFPAPHHNTDVAKSRSFEASTGQNGAPVQIILRSDNAPFETLRTLRSILESCCETEWELTVLMSDGAIASWPQDWNKECDIPIYSWHPTQPHHVPGCPFRTPPLAGTADIVVVRDGTVVFGDWLDRLKRTAYGATDTGSVTCLSNACTVGGYPHAGINEWESVAISAMELDAMARRVNAGEFTDVSIGSLQCVYIRADALVHTGFDGSRLAHPNGLDSFLCDARLEGLRHVLAVDVVVQDHTYNLANRSIAGIEICTDPSEPVTIVEQLSWLPDDPVQPYRRRLDAARIHGRTKGMAILFITHNLGGGTEVHTRQMSERLEQEGIPVIFCRPDSRVADTVLISDSLTKNTPNLSGFDLYTKKTELEETLRSIGICHVHIHHLAGFPEHASDYWVECAKQLNVLYDVTLHDYMAVCPRITLTDWTNSYCGEPELSQCERCVSRDGSPFGRPDVWAWRTRFGRLLTGARHLYVPNIDVAQRYERYYPGLRLYVRPHEETARNLGQGVSVSNRAGVTRRIGIIGAIAPHKGSRLLHAVASHAVQMKMPLQFVVVGHTDIDSELRELGNVTITGRYEDHSALDIIGAAQCDLIWFPTTCPETYSYTLSLALASRHYVVAFDLGAIAQRLRAARWGKLLPLEMMHDPDALALLLSVSDIPVTDGRNRLLAHSYPSPLQVSYYNFGQHRETPTGHA
jgi:glycosyltransferase involved in cell wall biosynthesis